MELLQIEEVDFDNNNLKAVFDGLFNGGFYVTTEFDYDEEQTDNKDDDTGSQDYFEATAISFWDFKTFNSDEEEISINDRELKKIKDMIEFKLIDLLTDYINNN